MSSVFLSYRREDSSGYAGRLYDRLVQRLGRQRLFMDIDNIEPGEDFVEVIDRKLAGCAVMLVVVGPRWASIADAQGRRRIDQPGDFHRLEIEGGLKHGVRLIPVLVGGAGMPDEASLPEPLRPLARRNASDISDTRFDFDVARLIEAVQRALESPAVPATAPGPPIQHFLRTNRNTLLLIGTVWLALLVGGALALWLGSRGTAPQGAAPAAAPQVAAPPAPVQRVEYRSRHILLATEEQARAVIAQLRAGARFEDLARTHSQDPASAQYGGDVGFGNPADYVPEYAQALVKLRQREYTQEPVKTQFGYHVIWLEDLRRVPQ